MPDGSRGQAVRWRVQRELGVQYAAAQPATPSPLAYPIVAERAADGSTLIVDKLSLRRCVPFSHEFRTLRVARDGAVLYDSQAQGCDDGYGCLLPDGGLALLRVARWEVQLLAPDGAVRRTLSVAACSKRPPMLVAATDRDSLLLTFTDRLYEVDIAEIGLDGRLRWVMPRTAYRFGCPSSVQRLPNDHLLVVDEFCSTATEIDRRGAVVRHFGKAKDSSRRLDRLSNPRFAQALPGGRWLVADTRNHRVLTVQADGAAAVLEPRDTELCCPTSAVALGEGRHLVSDAGNGRVIEFDARGAVVWQFGDAGFVRHALSFPRSVEPLQAGGYLVADTANDRVVRVRDGDVTAWPMAADAQLFWPRCARVTPRGTLLVADGRNGRVVELSDQGAVVNELRALQIEGGLALADPHDVRALDDGTVLVADASLDLVFVARWDGAVLWAAGRGHGPALKDPHSAQRLDDGTVLVCDTGASRVLRLDAAAHVVGDHDAFRDGDTCYRFNRPRHAEISPDGTFLVVDTGNNRILGADRNGEHAWELAELPDSPTTWLNQPRWASLVNGHDLLVTDHLHHRVLHLVRR